MFGEGILPGVLAQLTCDTTVTVVHRPPNSPPPACEFIYVGVGDDFLHPTPWSCPFVGQTLTRDRCANYIASRADSQYWLALLHGSCLLCTCSMLPQCCYGSMLAEAANSMLSQCLPHSPSGCDQESDCEDVLSADAYAHCKDDVDFVQPSEGSSEDSVVLSPQLDYAPRQIPWPPSWSVLVDDFRRSAVPLFWEIFSGTAGLTAAFLAEGWATAPPLDVCLDISFNLLNPLFLAIVVGIISEGRVLLLHLAPPCSSFSVALNSAAASAVRSIEFPSGLKELPQYKQDKVKLGNALADVMVTLASAQARVGRLVQFEQPRRSLMLSYPPVMSMMREFRLEAYQRDACVDGAPWRKPLLVITPTVKVGLALSATGPGGHEHIILRGPAMQGIPWTRVAAPYWPAWCRAIVRAWDPALRQELDNHARKQAGRPSLLLNQSPAMDATIKVQVVLTSCW